MQRHPLPVDPVIFQLYLGYYIRPAIISHPHLPSLKSGYVDSSNDHTTGICRVSLIDHKAIHYITFPPLKTIPAMKEKNCRKVSTALYDSGNDH